MRKVLKIDTDGYFVEDVLLQDDEKTPSDCIATICPDGFYRPKWNGAAWIEGGTVPAPTVEQQITTLKAELAETDYKIIKCSEYQLAGLEMPYDIAILHTERQSLRDQINTLEATLI